MKQGISVIGLDLAKSVFQVHGIGDDGEVITRRKLSRARVLAYFSKLEPCLVGMEACGTAHHWAREISALGHARHPWLVRLLERKPTKVAAIALANKMGRMIWALLMKGGTFNPERLKPA